MAYKDGQLLAVMAVKPAMDEVFCRLMKLRKEERRAHGLYIETV